MKLMSLGAVLIAAVVALNAPTTPTTRLIPKPATAPVIAVPPLRAAVLYDVTASRNTARISASLDDFAPLFDRLRLSGGEVGFGLIREDSDRPLIRCYVPAPPEPPTPAPPLTNGGNLFVNANNRKRNDAERKRYEAKRRAWEADATARINVFIVAITPLLDAPGDAPATDLTAAVERGDLMLAEPSEFANVTMAVILITDGVHNATAKTTPTMRSTARVAVVNGVGSMGALAKLTPTPLRFESTAAAVRYVADDGGTHVH
jgi:hypothetical protein